MIFERISTGNRKNVAYLVGDPDNRELAVVDMGYMPERILDRAGALGGRLKYMFATHSHRDHLGRSDSIKKVKEKAGTQLAAHKTLPDLEKGDVPLDDGDVVRLGQIQIEVIHTPGHTSDSLCFLINAEKLLTGDTLYVGRVPKGLRMRSFYDSLHERILTLPDDVEVWPGHDVGPRPSSTIGHERRTNEVLKMDYMDFRRRRWNGKRWEV